MGDVYPPLQHMTDWKYWWVFNAYPSVDTFLFVSAFLVSIFLKKRLAEFTFTSYCLQRYLRLDTKENDGRR